MSCASAGIPFYEVGTPGEFWLEALFHLGRQTNDPRWPRTYEELKAEQDETRLRERSLAQLLDFADSQKKRILLIVENFNSLLGNQINQDDAWTLRHTLLNEPRIMLLATATSRFEEMENADKAMYDLFKPLELRPLDESDCRKVWTSVTGQEPRDNRIKPLKILTGGNPRLLGIISSFGAQMSFKDLLKDLMHLVDDNTEYFKSHLDNLPTVERKAYLALAELWDPATAREVSKASRLQVSTASALLNRLVSRGAVEVVDERQRTKWYQVSERMYNIYHLMRRRGGPSGRVKAIVNFMVTFYGPEELVHVSRLIAEEACSLERTKCGDHYSALGRILECTQDDALRKEILAAAPKGFLEAAGMLALESLKENGTEKHNNAKTWKKVIKLLEQSRKLAETERPEAIREAANLLRKAIELAPKYAFIRVELGLLLEMQDDNYSEAESEYRKAIELDEDNSWLPLYCLGGLLGFKIDDFEGAEKAFRKALELKPAFADAWGHLGALLHYCTDRKDEAEQAYRKAVELTHEDPWLWEQLGLLLRDQERYDESEQALSKALELDSENGQIWALYGEILQCQKKYEEAENAYRKAIELKPDDGWTLEQLGRILLEQSSRFEEAEEALLKSIELNSENPSAWTSLGRVRERLGKNEEAEDAYKTVINLKGDFNSYVWIEIINALLGLLKLMLRDSNRQQDAMDLVESFLNDHSKMMDYPPAPTVLSSIAFSFYKNGASSCLAKAEEWAVKATRLAPSNGYCQYALGCIMTASGRRGGEALEPARKYLTNSDLVNKTIDTATELMVVLAATGYAKEALELLQESESGKHLEPLVVGLRLFLGEEVKVATEILEVGKDVCARIKERQLRVEAGK